MNRQSHLPVDEGPRGQVHPLRVRGRLQAARVAFITESCSGKCLHIFANFFTWREVHDFRVVQVSRSPGAQHGHEPEGVLGGRGRGLGGQEDGEEEQWLRQRHYFTIADSVYIDSSTNYVTSTDLPDKDVKAAMYRLNFEMAC